MRRKPAPFLSLLLISFMCQPSWQYPLASLIGYLSSVATLEQFIEVMYSKVFKSEEKYIPARGVFTDDKTMEGKVDEILKLVKDQPSLMAYVDSRKKLRQHEINIALKFRATKRMQDDINARKREDISVYEKFRDDYEPEIDDDIEQIETILVEKVPPTKIIKNFTEGLRLYENFYEPGMSYLQLLDSTLTQFHSTMAMYYITKCKMYDFIKFGNHSDFFEIRKFNLRSKIMGIYSHVVTEYQKIMRTASRELSLGDGPKTKRYENKPGGPYYELMAFTKYIMNTELYFDEGSQCLHHSCDMAINKTVDKCQPDHDQFGWCSNTRKCPRELISCQNLHGNGEEITLICINTNLSAYNRYIGQISEKLFYLFGPCDPVYRSATAKDLQYFGHVSNRNSEPIASLCPYCNCICRENIYYISTDITWIPNGYDGMVVTGARLVVEDNTIYIQVQLGKLMSQGRFNASTIQWQPIKKDGSKVEISWEGVRSVDLTTTMLPEDEIISGMQFKLSPFNKERIYLHLHTCKVFFYYGSVYLCQEKPYTKNPRNKLNLDEADVPTKATTPNAPDSNENQYVTFTTTHTETDGGQTTIPFIDTQIIETNPTMMLSGAGLYHRGQKGYGGFLALKLYAYDLARHVRVGPGIPELEDFEDSSSDDN